MSNVSRLKATAVRVAERSGWVRPSERALVRQWLAGDPLSPPTPTAKRQHLLAVLRARGHREFVEAGTYVGDTTASFVPHADRIATVELHDGLHAAAAARFASTPSVRVVHGDSLVEIPKIVAACTSAPLVFLDGHYSGAGTAEGVEMEPSASTLAPLSAVAPPGTTIVIDDLRLFGTGQVGFPQLDVLTAAARAAFPEANLRVGLDSFVIETPEHG